MDIYILFLKPANPLAKFYCIATENFLTWSPFFKNIVSRLIQASGLKLKLFASIYLDLRLAKSDGRHMSAPHLCGQLPQLQLIVFPDLQYSGDDLLGLPFSQP